jgi:tetratricopeptide (TPR) repeat protein
MSHPNQTLQDILRRRQKDEFIGRTEHLAFYRQNLEYPVDSDLKRFIFSVSGQAGVGKTSLLRRFRHVSDSFGALSVWTDEAEISIPEVLAHFSTQLEKQGVELKSFNPRYKVYREKRQELEADPEAPQGFPALIGRAIAKGGVRLGRRIPVGGVAFDFVDEDTLTNLMGDVATYVARRITNKDEAQLVLEPTEVLTPLFLKDIEKLAEKKLVCLFFDTYERTSIFLDDWLRDVLEGRFGLVPSNILISIAGQQELDKSKWAPYEGLTARVGLGLFSETETLDYLKQKGIADPQLSEAILKLSGRLPLLVAILASEGIEQDGLEDPTDTAVKRFLKSIDDPKRQQIALDASLPRKLNRDLVSVITESTEPDELFTWLKSMPFVLNHAEGWGYHSLARELMLRQKRHETQQGWSELHRKLAAYHEGLLSALDLKPKQRFYNSIAQSLSLEILYHRLCDFQTKHLSHALENFAQVFSVSIDYARRWAETVHQAGVDGESKETEEWGRKLIKGVVAFEKDDLEEVAGLFTLLLKEQYIPKSAHPNIYHQRAVLYWKLENDDRAFQDFSSAIELDPENGSLFIFRSLVAEGMDNFEHALSDVNHGMGLSQESDWLFYIRGRLLNKLGRHMEALDDLNRISDDKTLFHQKYNEIGRAYLGLNKLEEVICAFTKAIEIRPRCTRCWEYLIESFEKTSTKSRLRVKLHSLPVDFNDAEIVGVMANALLGKKHYEEALEEINRAISLNNNIDWLWGMRAIILRSLNRDERALRDINHAITINDKDPIHFANRAEILLDLEHYEEALQDFNRAIKLEKKGVIKWLSHRAKVYFEQGKYDKAFEDFDRAVALNVNNDKALTSRAIGYFRAGRFQKALEDFNRVIQIKPDNLEALVYRGMINVRFQRYDESSVDFDKVLSQDNNYAWGLYGRARLRIALERYEEAIDDLRKAMNIDPKLAHKSLTDIGAAFLEMGRHNKAINSYQKALLLSPSCTACWHGLAEAYDSSQETKKIPSLLRATRTPNPKSSNMIVSRGLAMLKRKLYQEALSEWGRALAIDSSNIKAISYRATVFFGLRQYSEALRSYERLVAIEPSRTEALAFEIGRALNNLGRYEEAISYFERAMLGVEDTIEVHYNITVATYLLKKLPTAQDSIETTRNRLMAIHAEQESIALYGLGGLESLSGNTDEALDLLERAIAIDEGVIERAKHDPAWGDLFENDKFQALTANYQIRIIDLYSDCF